MTWSLNTSNPCGAAAVSQMSPVRESNPEDSSERRCTIGDQACLPVVFRLPSSPDLTKIAATAALSALSKG
jgi:hypothetical protein